MVSLISTPIWLADCLMIWANWGISPSVSVSSGVEKPLGTPPLARSSLASFRFFARWGTAGGPTVAGKAGGERAVEGGGDRLADVLVGEGLDVGAHRELTMVARRQLDDVEAAGHKLRAGGNGEPVVGVDGARLEGGRHRSRVRVEGVLELGGLGRRAPVVRVAGECRPHRRCVARLYESARPDEGLLVLAEVVAIRDDDHVVVVIGDRVDEAAVGVVEMEGDRGVVDLHDTVRRQHPPEDRQRV